METAEFCFSNSSVRKHFSVHEAADNSKVSLTFQHYGTIFTQGLIVLTEFLNYSR